MESSPPEPPRPPTESVIAALLRTGDAVRLGEAPDLRHRLSRLRVRRCMRPPPLAVDPEMSVAEVEERMRTLGISWLPVVEGGRLVGVVARRDLEAALELRRGDLPRGDED